MARIVGNSIISAYELWRGRQRPMVTFSDDDDEIIRAPVPLHISTFHWWGYYLNMAPFVSCVVVHPNGFAEPHLTGGMKAFTPGRYQLFYIDMRDQTSLLAEVESNTRDNWRVRLTISLGWAVRDPLRVWRMTVPRETLVQRCMGSIANYIQSLDYHQLVPMPEHPEGPLDDTQIAQDILVRLQNNRALNGFRFINLTLLGRQGDPELYQIVKQSQNKLEEARRDQLVKVEEAKRDQVVFEARKQTAAAQNDLELEMVRGRLTREKEAAKIEAEIRTIMRETEQLWVTLEHLRQSQQLNHQKLIRSWEVTGDALTRMASILQQAQTNPSAQHLLSEQTVETLMKIMKQFTALMPAQNLVIDDPDEDNRVLPAVTINRSRP